MNGDNYSKALERAMNLCSRSEHCIKDMKAKLNSWNLTSERENEAIIQKLLDNKFIEEKRYARSYTRDKFRFNKWGKIKIRIMLKSRGINDNDIEDGLGMVDYDSYVKMIEEEMNNKRRSIKAKNLFDLKGKLYRFAESRGYEKEIFYDFINKLDS
jgi:regulatory protein